MSINLVVLRIRVNMKWFTSDLHLGHRGILNMGAHHFSSVEEMNNTITANIVSKLRTGDMLYIIGDCGFNRADVKKFLDCIPQNIPVVVVLGNHDHKIRTVFNQYRFVTVCDYKETKIGSNHIVMSHYPMLVWNRSHYDSWMLYGHIHKFSNEQQKVEGILQGKTLNVNIELNNFQPYSEDDIAAYMETRGHNLNYVRDN
jgi:calcineurin-like phosphoesterase family protein